MALDKLVDSEQLNNDLTVVANAIRAKGETSASLAFPNGFVSAIEDIQTGGGGGGSATDDVVFYDYDGSVAASYSSSDFANLTAMPANPSHTGLIAQGWNWSLANAKAYVAKYGKLNIGQMYITDDGKTRGRIGGRLDVGARLGLAPEAMFRTENLGDFHAEREQRIHQMGSAHEGGVVAANGHSLALQLGNILVH